MTFAAGTSAQWLSPAAAAVATAATLATFLVACAPRAHPSAVAPVARPTVPPPPDAVPVPAGTFLMGDDDEGPIHPVTLPAFRLGRTEVTVAQYRACVVAGACAPPEGDRLATYGAAGRDDHPVNYLDRARAAAYCAWAGGRLPTEAEWEYAARGIDGRAYPWGDAAPDAQLCWRRYHGGGAAAEGTCPVGAFPAGASAAGALDLAGGVWEWVADAYGPYPPGAVTAPTGPSPTAPDGRARDGVLRGGGWAYDDPSLVASTYRLWAEPGFHSYGTGARCAWPAGR